MTYTNNTTKTFNTKTEAIAASNTRCTHAAYEAITGETWTGHTLMTGQDLMDALRDAGYTYRTHCPADRAKTLRSLAKNAPTGVWYISTRNHAMAMVDGTLTDTMDRGFDGRHIKGMAQIVKVEG